MIRIIEKNIGNSIYNNNNKNIILGSINVLTTQIRQFAKPVEKPAKVFHKIL